MRRIVSLLVLLAVGGLLLFARRFFAKQSAPSIPLQFADLPRFKHHALSKPLSLEDYPDDYIDPWSNRASKKKSVSPVASDSLAKKFIKRKVIADKKDMLFQMYLKGMTYRNNKDGGALKNEEETDLSPLGKLERDLNAPWIWNDMIVDPPPIPKPISNKQLKNIEEFTEKQNNIQSTVEKLYSLSSQNLASVQKLTNDLLIQQQDQQPPLSSPDSRSSSTSNEWPVDLKPYSTLPSTPLHLRESAVILILCQNSDLIPLLHTLRQFEDRFNRRYKYPYLLINDLPFTPHFQSKILTSVSSPVEFGVVEPGTWEIPKWINTTVFAQCKKRMEDDGIMYGGSISYRHMCRWYSGLFYKHELMKKYKWYWRLEPGVEFYCDVKYDPFVYMAQRNKLYGFVITLLEIKETIPSLWSLTRVFAEQNGVKGAGLLGFLADEKGDYNGCHFWSNFEIARVDLWDQDLYNKYFEFLDKWGGFYYERWGDAPVHSIFVALTLSKSQVHYFHDIGYKHDDFLHCSTDYELEFTCICPKEEPFDWNIGSCLQRWLMYPEKGIDWDFNKELKPLTKLGSSLSIDING
ncbi:alpha 1,2-mannosyltransferase 2.4.1 [Nowakowskiella sp. JEL0407]|nr:alpha 1,2-mannosyltransferase 2.4.1 [Nowakowskiella sp. JEL0407]